MYIHRKSLNNYFLSLRCCLSIASSDLWSLDRDRRVSIHSCWIFVVSRYVIFPILRGFFTLKYSRSSCLLLRHFRTVPTPLQLQQEMTNIPCGKRTSYNSHRVFREALYVCRCIYTSPCVISAILLPMPMKTNPLEEGFSWMDASNGNSNGIGTRRKEQR